MVSTNKRRMTVKNADMPAMPVLNGDNEPANMGFEYYSNSQLATGLTKREMMAMHIAAGFAADGQITTDNVVKWSVEVADKLLQELDRTAK